MPSRGERDDRRGRRRFGAIQFNFHFISSLPLSASSFSTTITAVLFFRSAPFTVSAAEALVLYALPASKPPLQSLLRHGGDLSADWRVTTPLSLDPLSFLSQIGGLRDRETAHLPLCCSFESADRNDRRQFAQKTQPPPIGPADPLQASLVSEQFCSSHMLSFLHSDHNASLSQSLRRAQLDPACRPTGHYLEACSRHPT